MDIYGYNMYQHHRSDELANQVYNQQAFTPFPFNRPGPEPHNMPVPSGAPWNVQNVSWGLNTPPQLVQFTATPSTSGTIQCKRKSLDVEPVIPAKQLITEEKMAAHLNGLHISSNYTNYTLAEESTMEVVQPSTSSSMSIAEKLKGHKVVLADEIKKLREEPLLPASLIERLEKPCMSLMVWKPKEEVLNPKTDRDEDEGSTHEQTPRRNGILVFELNNNNNSSNNNNNNNFMDMEM